MIDPNSLRTGEATEALAYFQPVPSLIFLGFPAITGALTLSVPPQNLSGD